MDATALRAKMKLLLIGLLLSALSVGILIRSQLDEQYRLQTAEFEQIAASLTKSLAQHDALMPLLNNDDGFTLMQKKFPQIIQLAPLPVTGNPQAQVTLAAPGQYWLNNHFRHIRLLIDARRLINTLPQLANFQQVSLLWEGQRLYQSGTPDKGTRWHWSRQLNSASQPFLLTASSHRPWHLLSWDLAAALVLMWAVVILTVSKVMQQNHRRKVADLRVHFFELTRMDTINEMTAGMAHELNQPLTAVMSYNQSALRLLEMQQYDRIPAVLEASVLQVRRISSLLQAWRDNLQNQPAERKPVDIRQIWRRVEMLLDRELREAEVKIEYRFASPLPELLAVPLWLEQIFHNLLSNAIQAQQGQDKAWVSVTALREGNALRLEVSDGGPGLSEQALSHVFIPFFTTREEGIGLGMTLAETLILKMNGRIEVANRPQGGACFTLWLPLEVA
ncbi:ATP-binding protein [Erwinia rhapontici]|uniref:histidine kinase n=2 Tax=Erwiniaceae TaxID=1903409 RepID=A0ABN6DFD0_ERWRD|nr:two-component sensor histidine kinase [Erwinia rhapontici]BCQ43434.1 two-component sensor histidine kinase [Erwinia rhapontici]